MAASRNGRSSLTMTTSRASPSLGRGAIHKCRTAIVQVVVSTSALWTPSASPGRRTADRTRMGRAARRGVTASCPRGSVWHVRVCPAGSRFTGMSREI